MFKKIAIVERSKILREGLSLLLLTNKIADQVISLEDFKEWMPGMKGVAPDLVIISPDLVRDTTDKLRSKFEMKPGTLFVGLIYQYYTLKEVTEMFDEVIYITDSEEVFLNKFRNLFKKEVRVSGVSDRLTGREKAVLVLLLRGNSNKEVAEQLSISHHTVVTHRKNIVEKTGIRSLSGLAVYAILNNIADLEDLKQ